MAATVHCRRHCRLCLIVSFALLLLSYLVLGYWTGISFSSLRLTCIDSEGTFEEEIELGGPKDTYSLLQLLRINMQLVERRLEAQQRATVDMEKRNEQLMKQLEVQSRAEPQEDESILNTRSKIPSITPSVIHHQKSEFDLIPFVAFTKNKLYQIEPGLTHRPEDTPRGDKKAEMDEIIATAVQILNKEGLKEPGAIKDAFAAHHLVDGVLRTDHVLGTQYELYFSSNRNVFHHLTLFRPFAAVQKVKTDVIDKSNEWINLILPLSGRMETFKQFMGTVERACIKGDKRVHLTVVYFGHEDLQTARDIVFKVTSANNFTHVTFVERDAVFSRGLGLLMGAQVWNQGNVLMFFCDVDIYFDEGFLDRCRLNAEPGRKVYYPMVFSLYNPDIVYQGRRVPEWQKQLVIGKNNGYWRDFGFGMTCLYRSDFLYMKGFDTRIEGWGAEDVKLYRKFLSSNFEVVRAPDRGIFHLYHPKHCDITLSKEQYQMCLGSKALSEASPGQLAVLAFKELQQQNQEYHIAHPAHP